MSLTHYTRDDARAAQAARAVCMRRATPTAARRPPPHDAAPTATGCLISHYNLRAARFLPLLLPRFVLRIIECIPLAPAAMRGERRPDNSRVQLRRRGRTRDRRPSHRSRATDINTIFECYQLRHLATRSGTQIKHRIKNRKTYVHFYNPYYLEET